MTTFKVHLLSVFVLVCLLAAFPGQYVHAQGSIIYVKWDATGPTHDGSSWTKAYTDLQSALAATRPGTQIWVAAGTYKPTTGSDRNIFFKLQSGVHLYGGFAGNETTLLQRDPLKNVTILSGDIGTPGVATDNSYHVIRKAKLSLSLEYVELDGFTITGGNANSTASGNTSGGGLDLSGVTSDELKLKNMIFRDNSAAWEGGGVSAPVRTIVLENVTFENNKAGNGGGLYMPNISDASVNARLSNVVFRSNSARELAGGGGLYASDRELLMIMRDVLFENNESAEWGGGMFFGGEDGGLNLKNVTFRGNTAKYGGGLFMSEGHAALDYVTFSGNKAMGGEFSSGGGLHAKGNVTLSHAIFQNNKAESEGGAIDNLGEMTISDSAFYSNATTNVNCGGGAAIANDVYYVGDENTPVYGILTVTNSTFYDNRTTGVGGGIYNHGIATISYSTFSHNSAAQSGAGIYSSEEIPDSGGILTLNNSILANSANGRDCLSPSGSFSGDHNLIENNGVGSCACGSPLLTSDPDLGPLQHNGGFTPTMALLPGSPARDAGDDAVCAAVPVNNLDQRGILRPKGSHCDLGAYEALPLSVGAGTYDDTDPAWSYTGDWVTFSGSGPYNDSLHQSNTTGSYAEVFFTGEQITLTYLRAPGRGLIDVYLDGIKMDTIDPANPTIVWQSTWASPTLPTGVHTVRFENAGGGWIDIDAVQIQ